MQLQNPAIYIYIYGHYIIIMVYIKDRSRLVYKKTLIHNIIIKQPDQRMNFYCKQSFLWPLVSFSFYLIMLDKC